MARKTSAGPSVDELIARLSDPRGSVRADAAYELSDCYDSRAVDPLIPLLRDPKPQVRANAAYALYHLGARHIGEELLPLLSDPAVEVRLSAILAMGKCPEPRALEPILARLEDQEESVRDFARQYGFASLGALAVPALFHRLLDPRDFMRAGAARALSMPSRRRLGGAPEWVQTHYPYALSDQTLLEVLEALTRTLSDADPSVRYQAIRSLEVHGDPRTAPALLDALIVEEDEGNRATIGNCLRQCNAGPLLDQHIADPDCSVSARAATGLSYFIWSMLKDGADVSARLCEFAPEHRQMFDQVTAELVAHFSALEIKVRDAIAGIVAYGLDPQDRVQRRKIAYRIRRAVSPELVPAVRRALEGKSYDHLLWSMLQPSGLSRFV